MCLQTVSLPLWTRCKNHLSLRGTLQLLSGGSSVSIFVLTVFSSLIIYRAPEINFILFVSIFALVFNTLPYLLHYFGKLLSENDEYPHRYYQLYSIVLHLVCCILFIAGACCMGDFYVISGQCRGIYDTESSGCNLFLANLIILCMGSCVFGGLAIVDAFEGLYKLQIPTYRLIFQISSFILLICSLAFNVYSVVMEEWVELVFIIPLGVTGGILIFNTLPFFLGYGAKRFLSQEKWPNKLNNVYLVIRPYLDFLCLALLAFMSYLIWAAVLNASYCYPFYIGENDPKRCRIVEANLASLLLECCVYVGLLALSILEWRMRVREQKETLEQENPDLIFETSK